MRPPTSAATPPGPSSAIKRQRRAAAAPLSDVTNLLLLPETPTPIKPARTRRATLPTPSAASSTCSSTASVTPTPKSSSAADPDKDRSVLKSPISTVYARRGTTETQGRRRNPATTTTNKGKGKEPVAAAGTASCPPLGRATRKTTRKDSIAQDTRTISASAPCHGAKKKRPPPSTPKLPEDFVKKQRAYFAEIDAFDLPVEEVSESELE
ncbi:hypothetical protein HU200_050048 [Digitaria exilis]|uniref:Sororin C-terminal region domain-containing protein n=1 Tax=Digitaria exilis TaxID=1010633 RepID=A0A835EAP7_9POAL|nr:hypothetical protein HU200_050048 [Digitaria exilis]CAB3488860.1 unnamed protein product [Digitaria exilis]